MTVTLGIPELLGIIACSQALILGSQLWLGGTGNRAANRVLALYILAQAIYLGFSSWAFSAYRPPYFELYRLMGVIYLFGPLFFVYARLLAGESTSLWACRWHFLVPLLLWWGVLPLLLDTPTLVSHHNYGELPLAVKRQLSIVSMSSQLVMLVYALWTLDVLRNHRARIREHFSDLDRINLHWLAALAHLMWVMAALHLFSDGVGLMFGVYLWPATMVSFVATILIINYIGVMSIRQPVIFHGGAVGADNGEMAVADAEPEAAAEAPAEGVTGKYDKSGLDDERAQAIWQKLEQAMTEQDLYLQHGLKLSDLARYIATRGNYLSQVINSCAGVNFYEYVNGYRVHRAQQLLRDTDRGVADIAEASGFSSLNAFNTHFKKRAGMTPSEFRKQAGAAG